VVIEELLTLALDLAVSACVVFVLVTLLGGAHELTDIVGGLLKLLAKVKDDVLLLRSELFP